MLCAQEDMVNETTKLLSGDGDGYGKDENMDIDDSSSIDIGFIEENPHHHAVRLEPTPPVRPHANHNGASSKYRCEVIKQSELRRRFATKHDYLDFVKSYTYKDPHAPRHQKGPDYIIPTEGVMAWDAEGAVRIRVGESGPASMEPLSVISLLRQTVSTFPDSTALSVTRNDVTHEWTYTEYWRDVTIVAKAFMKLGLLPLHSVAVAGFNSPEWFIADLGAIFAGGIATGMYQTNSPEENYHILADSRANIVVVEDEKQLQKVLKVRERLPNLRAIVQYRGQSAHPDVLTWQELLEIGETVSDQALEYRIRGIALNQCCTLIYTSGTTGTSKGVMISHDNMTYEARLVSQVLDMGQERMISYLPLSHVAAQSTEMYGGFVSGSCVYFAQPDALKGSLKDTLVQVRPTRWFGVPRVFEKMYEAMWAREQRMGMFGRRIFRLARKIGYKRALMSNSGSNSTPYGFCLVSILLRKVQKALGLDQCKTIMCAGAPISTEVLEYFHSLNIMVREAFGMSETVLHTFNRAGSTIMGSIGHTAPSLETRIFEPDASGQGELCMRGRHVCMGYLNMEDRTTEAIDLDGWLHSGDLARSDAEQFLYITGRIKEILITAGGENVAPVPIEERIKKELPIVSFAVVIGDRKKFLSVLLTLTVTLDKITGQPSSQLTNSACTWFKGIGLNVTTLQEVCALQGINEQLRERIDEAIIRANENAVSNAARVQKWMVVPEEFSVNNGELGPTLKLRRPNIYKKYTEDIDKIYTEAVLK